MSVHVCSYLCVRARACECVCEYVCVYVCMSVHHGMRCGTVCVEDGGPLTPCAERTLSYSTHFGHIYSMIFADDDPGSLTAVH